MTTNNPLVRVDTLRDPLLRRFHNQAYSHRLDVYMYLYLVQVMKVPVDPAAVAAVPLVDGVPDLWPLIKQLVRRWVRTATRHASRMMLQEVDAQPVMVSVAVEQEHVRVVLQLTEVAAAEVVQQQLSRAYSSSASLGGVALSDNA